MVLVLLGLLAATATPKFFDLSHGSHRLATETAFNEVQVRINARFSRLMDAGLSYEDVYYALYRLYAPLLGGRLSSKKFGKPVCSVDSTTITLYLFLSGYFDAGYLGYEAANHMDWVWEHRINDFDEVIPSATRI